MSETFSDWQCEALPYSSTRVKHTQAEYARIKILRVHALGNITEMQASPTPRSNVPRAPFPRFHSSPLLLLVHFWFPAHSTFVAHPSTSITSSKTPDQNSTPSESSTFLHNDEAYLHYYPLRSLCHSHDLAHSKTPQHVPSRKQE